MMSLIYFILIITVLVFFHELGHYMAARSVGVRVEKFYIGFNLFGLGLKKMYNGTEYGLGLFPFGGYVKVAGVIDESLDDSSDNVINEYKGIHKPGAPKGIPYTLDSGDMIIYSGCELEHWREPFQGKLCGQVFLHYNHANGPFAKTNLYDKRPILGIPKLG